MATTKALLAQAPPAPVPDPNLPNVFYGAIKPSTLMFNTPVLVFVPGLGGVAADWFTGNDMYAFAYNAGYRTAFVSPNRDNSPAISDIVTNAAVLKSVLPSIANHYGTSQLYLIGHSKGGLDLQAAVVDATVGPLVKAIFTISTPNSGTELADWVFAHPGLGQAFNLLTPAVSSMKLSNAAMLRTQADPFFMSRLDKPLFTFTGDDNTGNLVTRTTGAILQSLVPGTTLDSKNDGLVTVGRSRLSPEFSSEIGTVPTHHFNTDTGSVSFTKIAGRINGLESDTGEFRPIAVNGLARFGGNERSSLAWSMKWFKGKLYVGTSSDEPCVSLLTSDVRNGTSVYNGQVQRDMCPDPVTLAGKLQAEIWQYTPATDTWKRVFQSPQDVPVTVNGVNVLTARDIGFRGMEIFYESDGTDALYVGGVTSGGVYEPYPFQPNGYPPPRILRTVDGETWTPLPQPAGTFLGEIGNSFLTTDTKIRSIRSLRSFNGKLFATAGSYVGSGVIIASSNPAAGGDAWTQVSPTWAEMPVWDLQVYSNRLYVTTGFTNLENPSLPGYSVYRTDAAGSPPYQFQAVITNGGYQSNSAYRAPNGLHLFVYRNELYLGTNRPTELIRIRPNDTWDLIVGEPRLTPSGYKAPLSGLGNGFGNWMNGHFWRMGSHNVAGSGRSLFLGTWDWGVLMQSLGFVSALDSMFTHQYGTDLYRTSDGVHWSAVTQSGFGDPNNYGVRTMEETPEGLFLGTGRSRFGFEVLLRKGPPAPAVAPPARMRAQSGLLAGRNARLSWDRHPTAVAYNVYRATAVPLEDVLARPTIAALTLRRLLDGGFDQACPKVTPGSDSACAILRSQAAASPSPFAFPQPYQLIAQTTTNSYSEPAPTRLQSLYYVRAVNANGNLSPPSNIVGAPSKALPIPVAACDIDSDADVDANDLSLITEVAGTPAFGPDDSRDADHNGQIGASDEAYCRARCSRADCSLP